MDVWGIAASHQSHQRAIRPQFFFLFLLQLQPTCTRERGTRQIGGIFFNVRALPGSDMVQCFCPVFLTAKMGISLHSYSVM